MITIHGAFCAGWAFEHWHPRLAAMGFDCHGPDLPFHDQAPDEAADPRLATASLLDYAAWLEIYIAGLELDRPPILIGHSMGGLIAQILASRGLARALILLAPSAPWGVLPTTEHEFYSALGLACAGQGAWWSLPLIPSYAFAAELALDRLPAQQRRKIFSRFVPESGQATFEILHWALDFNRASRVHPGDVTVPVLAIAGEQDRVTPAQTVRQIARRYRGVADFLALDGYSHWLHGEPGWENIMGVAMEWLNRRL